jgi:hypothetical protein
LIHAHEEARFSEQLQAEHPDLAARQQKLIRLERLQHVEEYVNAYCKGVRESWPILQRAIAAWELPPCHNGQMSIIKHPMSGPSFFHWLDPPLTGRLVKLDKDKRPIWPVSSERPLVKFEEELCKLILPAAGTRCIQIAGPRKASDINNRPIIHQEILDFFTKCEHVLDDGTIAPYHPTCLLCKSGNGESSEDMVSCIMCMTTFHQRCISQLPPVALNQISDCHRGLLQTWAPKPIVVYKILGDMQSSIDALCHNCKVLAGTNRRTSYS